MLVVESQVVFESDDRLSVLENSCLFSCVTFGGSSGIVNHGSNCESFGDESGPVGSQPCEEK